MLSTNAKRPALGYGLVLLAAGLWATMGLIYKQLIGGYGLLPLAVVFWRATVAAVALAIYLGARHRQLLRLERRHWLFMALFGLVGVALFYIVYVYAVDLVGVGVAAVLMYTAPVWVVIISGVSLNEPLTGRTIASLALAVLGCALVGKAYDGAALRVNAWGLLAGLGAGLTYGLYTVFCKLADHRGISPRTTQVYALALGALFLLPLQQGDSAAQVVTSPGIIAWLLVLGLIPTLGGGLAFSAAMRHLPASRASIVATVEPLIALFLGWLLLGEQVSAAQLVGAGCIVVAVVLLQLGARDPTLLPADPSLTL